MSYIPNCREDGTYNQKYLLENDAEFVAGFDWCTRQGIYNFFDNIDIYEGELEVDGCDVDLLLILRNHEELVEKLRDCMLHYAEMERDELITSMIDGMNTTTFKERKKKVDAGEIENCLSKYAFEQEGL